MINEQKEKKVYELRDKLFDEFSGEIGDIDLSMDTNEGEFSIYITQALGQTNVSSKDSSIDITIEGTDEFNTRIRQFLEFEGSDLEIR